MKKKRAKPRTRKIPPDVPAGTMPGEKIGARAAARAELLRKNGVHVRRNRSHTYG